MTIHEYYYIEEKSTLHIEFESVRYYSPTIISEYEINEIDEDFVIDLISEYLKENELPEQVSL